MGLFKKKSMADKLKQVINPKKITIVIGKGRKKKKKKKKVKKLACKQIRVKGKKKK